MSALEIDLIEGATSTPAAAEATTPPDLPKWARSQAAAPPMPRRVSLWPVLLIGGGAIAISVAGWAANTHQFVIAGQAMVVAAFAVAVFFLLKSRDSEIKAVAREQAADRQRAEVYDRAGISIWREDWTPVAKRIIELRQSGVTNIPQWFERHPKEREELHSQVLITDVNRYTLELMGAESKGQLLGSLRTVLPGSANTFLNWIERIDRADEIYIAESRVRRLNGSPLDCLVTAALPTNLEGFADIVVSIVDISAYKRDQERLAEAQDEVARAQRIATMGALTASIAHEVNSPLAAITSNAGACLRWLQREEPDIGEAQEAARSVIADAERAQAVIERTRRLLGRSARVSVSIDLIDLIRRSSKLVEREAQNCGVQVLVEVDGPLRPVHGDPIQIQQVLLNLMLNAIQAMGAGSTSRILRVTAKAQEQDMLVAVSDTGPGIPTSELEHVFQPFYSTKEQGMGMGLAISRSCIESHGGTMWISSAKNEGATVTFTLPFARDAEQ